MDFFGLDIGSHNLKIAQIKKSGGKAHLVAFASAPTPPRALLSESESDLTALATAIKKLHQEAEIKTKKVAVSLPEDKVFTKVVTFPKLSDDELKSAIKWEAEQYIPIPLEEVTLDYQIVGEVKDGTAKKSEVLLVAAPKRLIEKFLKVLKAAGLEAVSLETEVLALSRGLIDPKSNSTLLVDLGARASDMAIVEKGRVVFTRSISTAGESITRAVAATLGLEPGQAEEYKKAYGADPKRLEGKVRQAIGPVLETIVRELERVIAFYRTAKKKEVNRVVLAGGTAILPEVVSLLAEKLNLEIQVGDPFARLEKDEKILEKIPGGISPLYATAVGLALKEL